MLGFCLLRYNTLSCQLVIYMYCVCSQRAYIYAVFGAVPYCHATSKQYKHLSWHVLAAG